MSIKDKKYQERIDKHFAKYPDKRSAVMPLLHIAQEEYKFGYQENDLIETLNSDELKMLQNIRITGLMGMATFTEDVNQIRNEFRYLKNLFDRLKIEFQLPNIDFQELSMGMSDDYMIAMEEGSTMVRVGSKIFGPRIYL